MKKLLLSATIVAALFFASCKKDRVCTCTYSDGTGASLTREVTYTKASKKAARSQCLSAKQVQSNGTTLTADCKLK